MRNILREISQNPWDALKCIFDNFCHADIVVQHFCVTYNNLDINRVFIKMYGSIEGT